MESMNVGEQQTTKLYTVAYLGNPTAFRVLAHSIGAEDYNNHQQQFKAGNMLFILIGNTLEDEERLFGLEFQDVLVAGQCPERLSRIASYIATRGRIKWRP